jgi:hypothetical protein
MITIGRITSLKRSIWVSLRTFGSDGRIGSTVFCGAREDVCGTVLKKMLFVCKMTIGNPSTSLLLNIWEELFSQFVVDVHLWQSWSSVGPKLHISLSKNPSVCISVYLSTADTLTLLNNPSPAEDFALLVSPEATVLCNPPLERTTISPHRLAALSCAEYLGEV